MVAIWFLSIQSCLGTDAVVTADDRQIKSLSAKGSDVTQDERNTVYNWTVKLDFINQLKDRSEQDWTRQRLDAKYIIDTSVIQTFTPIDCVCRITWSEYREHLEYEDAGQQNIELLPYIMLNR